MKKLAVVVLAIASSPALAGRQQLGAVGLPTLGEFGLIALAGVLGVAAAVVLRKKK